MSTVYINYQPITIARGKLDLWLNGLNLPPNVVVALDTETSGLFVDGDWGTNPSDCSPPARVSVVSLAWRDPVDGRLNTVALPFDQGKIGGKPGTWSPELDGFETLPHTNDCDNQGKSFSASPNGCICAPWNLAIADYLSLTGWLRKRERLVMHHKKFDCHICSQGPREVLSMDLPPVMREWLSIDLMPMTVWDTMLAQGIIDPTEPSSLKPTAKRLWGEEEGNEKAVVDAALRKLGKGLTKRYDLLAWDIIGPYAAKDAELTLRLAEYPWDLIETGALDSTDQRIIRQEFELSALLYRMEQRGVGFDADAMRAEADKMRGEVSTLEATLPFKPATITAAKKYFFDTLGLPAVKEGNVCTECTYNREKNTYRKNTKRTPCEGMHKWAPSLDAEVVTRLANDKVPGAQEWLDLANINSALSKWYVAWPYKCGKDGRLRTNFRQGRIESDRKGMTSGGAISGRLSAERIQLQGVPQEWRIPKGIKPVKKMFRARPGFVLVEFDLSNAEVRVAAWVSKCKALADRINSGENIHDSNTRAIFGIDEDHPQWNQMRTSAKRGIFGRMYGAGIQTLKAQIDNDLREDIPEWKIREFMAALDAAYPELKATARRAQKKADKTMGGCGFVRLVNGRRRVFGWAERTHKAFNAIIQGGVAETMKEWMLLLEREMPGALVNQVHDSVWLELPEDRWENMACEVQMLGRKLFESRFSTDDIPIMFTVDAKRIA